jgi:hypothetical protein
MMKDDKEQKSKLTHEIIIALGCGDDVGNRKVREQDKGDE